MKKLDIKRIAIYLIGCFILGFGIAINDHATLGVDAMSSAVLGFTKYINVSFGMMTFIVSVVLIIFGFFTDREKVTIYTFIGMIFTSIGIDSFSLLGFQPITQPIFQYLVLMVGICVYAFGIAITIEANVGLSALDCAVFGVIKLIKKDYHVARTIIDVTFLVIALVLGSNIGTGTIIIVLTIGRIVEMMQKLIQKSNLLNK